MLIEEEHERWFCWGLLWWLRYSLAIIIVVIIIYVGLLLLLLLLLLLKQESISSCLEKLSRCGASRRRVIRKRLRAVGFFILFIVAFKKFRRKLKIKSPPEIKYITGLNLILFDILVASKKFSAVLTICGMTAAAAALLILIESSAFNI